MSGDATIGTGVRAALYARVSTDQQAERYGLGAQVTALQERVAHRGYRPVSDGTATVFADDGYSGGDLNRPALTRLRDAVQQGRVDVVLCLDPDRLSRALRDQLLLADEVEHAGAALEFLTQEMDASPEGRLFFAIRGAVAEFEKAKIRQRTMRGKQEKARRGLVVNPANLPRWLHVDPVTHAVSLDPEWAAVVRDVFHWYVDEGWTLRRVARHLTALGQPTPTGGTQWQPTVLHHWLRSPATAGTYYQLRMDPAAPATPRQSPRQRARPSARNGKQLRDPEAWWAVPVPAVVDADRWAAAQQRLDHNKQDAARNTRHAYRLRGLVVCGTCGARMAGYPPSPGRWRYRCGRVGSLGRVRGGGTCPQPVSIDASWLDAHVWTHITALLQSPAALAEALAHRHAATSPTRTAAEAEQHHVHDRLAAITREMEHLVAGYGKGLIPDALMKTQMDTLSASQAELTARAEVLAHTLAQLEASAQEITAATAYAARMAARLDTLTPTEQATLLHRVVRRVVVQADTVVVDTILPTDPDPGPGNDAPTLCTTPQDRCRPPRLPADFTPFAEAIVRGEREAARFVARADDAEEPVRLHPLERTGAAFIDAQELRARVHRQAWGEALFLPGFAQVGHQILHRDAGHGGPGVGPGTGPERVCRDLPQGPQSPERARRRPCRRYV